MPIQNRDRGIPLSREGIKRVRQGLRELGLTQKQFAERAHFDVKTLERALKGKPVDDPIREAIARALGIDELDLTDPHGIRFLNWDEIRQNSLDQLPPLLTEVLADRLGRKLDGDGHYIELTLHRRKRLPSYPSITQSFEGSDLYELGANEINATLTTKDFINQFLSLHEVASPPGKHTVVVGTTGAGKTTLLHAFVRMGLDYPDFTTIYVPLAELQNQPIKDYLDVWLKKALKRDGGGVSELEKKALIGRFREQQVILLLDSGNEITDARIRLNSLDQVLRESWVGLAHIVFACRPSTWNIEQNPLNGKLEVYQLSPLHYGDIRQVDQVSQLIETRFEHNPALGVRLRARLEHPEQVNLRDLVRNPMNLTILCHVWEQSERLPSTLNQLYANFVRLISGYESTPLDPLDFSHEPLLRTAGLLARRAIQSTSPFRLPLRYIHQTFRAEKLNWDEFAQLKQTGLLHLIGNAQEDRNDEVYAYLHPVLQNFLAAGVIESEDFFLGQLSSRAAIDYEPYVLQSVLIFNPQLLEVYLLWLGRQGDPELTPQRSLVQRLTNFDCGSEFYRYRAVFLAAAGLAELSEPDLVAPIMEQLRDWLHSGMESIRYGALAALQASQSAEAIGVIVEFIAANPNNLLSFQAIARLGLFRDQHKTQAEAGLAELARMEDLTICFLAGESLVRLDPVDRQRVLQQVELLVFTPPPFLSQVYARLFHPVQPEFAALYEDLYLSGSPPFGSEASARLWQSVGKGNFVAIDQLLEYLDSDRPEFVLQSAAIGLGELGSGQLKEVTALIRLLDRTEDGRTKEIAIASLKKFGINFPDLTNDLLNQGIEMLEVEQVVDLAMAQMALPKESQFLESHSNVEDGETYLYFQSMIYSWLENPYDFEQRYRIRQSLSQSSSGDSVLIGLCIEEWMRSADSTVRWFAVTLLGEIATGEDVETQVLEFFRSEEFKPARRAAAKSLAQILAKGANPVQKLGEFLNLAEEEEMKLWLAYQLGRQVPQLRATAINHLIHLILNSSSFESESIYAEQMYVYSSVVQQVAHCLTQLLTRENAASVVAGLQPYFNERVREEQPSRYRIIFDLLWNCACLLTPTEFNQVR